MTRERAEEIRRAIWASGGWGYRVDDQGRRTDCYTAEERAEIVAFWDTLPGTSTFYDAVARMAQGERVRCRACSRSHPLGDCPAG